MLPGVTQMNVVGPEPSSSSQATQLESSDGIVNAAYEDSDDGSVIIDGKRAVSLHNFGKYAAKEERRRSLQPASSKYVRANIGWWH